MTINATATEGTAKTEKSTATEKTKTEKSTATEKTTTIDEITTTHTSQNLPGNIAVCDKLYRVKIIVAEQI